MEAAVETRGTPPEIQPLVAETLSYAWIETLIVNACGYASVIIPGFLVIHCLKRSNCFQRHGMFSMDVVFILWCEFAINGVAFVCAT